MKATGSYAGFRIQGLGFVEGVEARFKVKCLGSRRIRGLNGFAVLRLGDLTVKDLRCRV